MKEWFVLSGKMPVKIIALWLCAVLICTGFSAFAPTAAAVEKFTGTVSSEVTSYLNVRTGPGTNNALLKLPDDTPVRLYAGENVTVTGTYPPQDSSGFNWYAISFIFQGVNVSGYVSSEFITVDVTPIFEELGKDFEEQLKAFPESYKPYLRALHLVHPDWQFRAFNTGLDWNEVIKNETVLGRSLISSSVLSYRSTQKGAYDWSKDQYIALDGSNWYQADEDVVRYYMDPRNFLNEADLFQFEALYYDEALQTLDGVKSMLGGSFMSGAYIDSPSGDSILYAQAFMEAAKQSGVSPYHLVSRVIQEVGKKGSSSVSGTVSGYEGIYNFYNIGATSSSNPVLNGLRFAQTGGSLSEASKAKYLIPWNSRYRSIVGGAKYISTNYISAGQNTLYLQKFDVDSSDGSLYWHQYMTNISASATEAVRMYDIYKELGIISSSIGFSIPVYKNMPAENCKLPEAKGSPNNLLKTLSVTGYEITPTFEIESDNLTYYLITDGNINSFEINAEAVNRNAVITGSRGKVSAKNGINRYDIKVTAQNGDVRTYTVVIVLNYSSFVPGDEDTTSPATTQPVSQPGTTNPQEPPSESEREGGTHTDYAFGNYATKVAPGTQLNSFISSLGLYGDASAHVNGADGERLESGVVGTGDVLVLTVKGVKKEYPIIIRGDVNGDGAINAVDLLMIRKNILNLYPVSGVLYKGADVNADGSINAVDLLMVRKHILKTYSILQNVGEA